MADSLYVAWNARWKAVIQDNMDWNPAFGLDSTWKDNFDDWGYPLENREVMFSFEGKDIPGRTFEKVGLVGWFPDGHRVLGW
jgi:hypothetical protein